MTLNSILFLILQLSTLLASDCPQKDNCSCSKYITTNTFGLKIFCKSGKFEITAETSVEFQGIVIDCSKNETNPEVFDLLPNMKMDYPFEFSSINSITCPLPRKFPFEKFPRAMFADFSTCIGSVVTEELFEKNIHLRGLKIHRCHIEAFSEEAFEKLENLETIYLTENLVRNLSLSILRENVNLREIVIHGMSNLRKGFKNYTYKTDVIIDRNSIQPFLRLEKIVISHTEIEEFPDDFFENNRNLSEIFLQWNQIQSLPRKIFSNLQYIEKIDLTGNFLTSFFYEKVSLAPVSVILQHNRINHLDITSSSNKPTSTSLSLENNPVKGFAVTCKNLLEDDNFYINIFESRVNPMVQCDLMLHNLIHTAETVPQIKFLFSTSRCIENNKYLQDLKSSDLFCVSDGYFSTCRCIYDVKKFSMLINCANVDLLDPPDLNIDSFVPNDSFRVDFVKFYFMNNSLKLLPEIPRNFTNKVTEIYAGNNSIHKLETSNLGPHLKILDLRENQLSSLSDEVLTRFSSINEVYFAGNPWLCHCQTLEFFESFKSSRGSITDFDENICENFGKKFDDLSTSEVCFNWPLFGVLAMTFGLLGSSIAIFYKFKKDIKIFLYAHDMCLWFISEDELDKGRNYDAFVCFAADDQEIVEEIVFGLENEPNGFRCLVGIRDWAPGRQFAQLIDESVEQSRRTIIFLSENFIGSNWCRHEFRVAQTETSSDRRSRIIVITYGDVVETEKMDDELKSYLQMHLYIKFEDPRFWQKLRYAMPHKKRLRGDGETRIDNGIEMKMLR